MTIRPNNLETVRLTLELLKRIPRSGHITASALHKQLTAAGIKRGIRTIERQLEGLTEHFDIECDARSRPYGYRWKSHSKGFSLPMLNEQESLLLALAQQYLQNLLPASLMSSMEGFFQQARVNLNPYPTTNPESEWRAKIRVVDTSQPLLPPSIDSDAFEAVSTALYKNRWLEVSYRNAAGKESVRNIMPLGLAQQGPRLYLVCRYEGYENERSLAVHRIKKAKVSAISFTRPPEFNLQKYEEDGRFGFGEGEFIKLSFNITKPVGRHLLETPLSKDQSAIDLESHYAITATVVDSLILTKWLNGFAEDVWDVKRAKAGQPAN